MVRVTWAWSTRRTLRRDASASLHYELYFTKGHRSRTSLEDYHSHSTQGLEIEETKRFLVTIPTVQEGERRAAARA